MIEIKYWWSRGGSNSPDLRIANATLSQLSYGPTLRTRILSCSYERHAKRRILPEFFARDLPDYANYGPSISITVPLRVLEQSGKLRGAVVRSDVPNCMTEERLAVL